MTDNIERFLERVEIDQTEHERLLKLIELDQIDEAISGLGGPAGALAYVAVWRETDAALPTLCGAVRYKRDQEDLFGGLLDGTLVPNAPEFECLAQRMANHPDIDAAVEVHRMALLKASAEKKMHLKRGGKMQ